MLIIREKNNRAEFLIKKLSILELFSTKCYTIGMKWVLRKVGNRKMNSARVKTEKIID